MTLIDLSVIVTFGLNVKFVLNIAVTLMVYLILRNIAYYEILPLGVPRSKLDLGVINESRIDHDGH